MRSRARLGRLEIDRLYFDECKVALAFFRRSYLPGDGVTGPQVELPNLRRRDVDVIRARQIVIFGGAQKTEAVRQTFENTFGEYESALFRLRLQNLENEILLAHRRGAHDPELFCNHTEAGDIHLLELGDVQGLLLLAARRLFRYLFGARLASRTCLSITVHSSFLPSVVTAEKVMRGTPSSVA